jgi:hypothetical protein
MSESLTVGNGRRNDCVQSAIAVGTGGQTDGKKSRKNVVVVFFIRRKQAVFDQELKISESILDGRIVVHQVRRIAEDDFHTPKRN